MKKIATIIITMVVLFCGEMEVNAFSPKDLATAEQEIKEDEYWDYVIEYEDRNDYDQYVTKISREAQKESCDVVVVPESNLLKIYIKKNKQEGDINKQITEMNNRVGGLNRWTIMQLNGLALDKKKEIEEVEDCNFFSISEIQSNDLKTFSIQLETYNYYIESGDTLGEIAQKKRTTVEELMRLNPQIKNPDLIFAGRMLKVK